MEPAIAATIREHVDARLKAGIPADHIRALVPTMFVDVFADDIPRSFVPEYRKQVVAFVESAIQTYPQRSQPCSQSSTSGEPAEPPQNA